MFGKMKNKTVPVAIEEFVGLKSKMYLYLVDNNSEHKKAKGVNKNVVATVSHNMFCWTRNVWDIQWIGFKENIIK